MNIIIEGPIVDLKSGAVCDYILHALPAWFGIEEAVVQYVNGACENPTLIAWDGEIAVGFLTLKQHNLYAAEVYVMGVLPEYHRCGVGRMLVQRAEAVLRERGMEYLQVKTLAPSHPDESYARTRAFYEAVGFRPLEVLPQIWDKANPCLIMVKGLTAG